MLLLQAHPTGTSPSPPFLTATPRCNTRQHPLVTARSARSPHLPLPLIQFPAPFAIASRSVSHSRPLRASWTNRSVSPLISPSVHPQNNHVRQDYTDKCYAPKGLQLLPIVANVFVPIFNVPDYQEAVDKGLGEHRPRFSRNTLPLMFNGTITPTPHPYSNSFDSVPG